MAQLMPMSVTEPGPVRAGSAWPLSSDRSIRSAPSSAPSHRIAARAASKDVSAMIRLAWSIALAIQAGHASWRHRPLRPIRLLRPLRRVNLLGREYWLADEGSL
jgi:hypothetical protein